MLFALPCVPIIPSTCIQFTTGISGYATSVLSDPDTNPFILDCADHIIGSKKATLDHLIELLNPESVRPTEASLLFEAAAANVAFARSHPKLRQKYREDDNGN